MKHSPPKEISLGLEDGLSNSFPVVSLPRRGYSYSADIFGVIESPSQFSDIVAVLNYADEDTDVCINIQTPGGSIDATDYLLHALQKTKANIHMVATGGVHSSGSIILLHADSFELSDGFSSLIHCGSLGHYGTFSEFGKYSTFVAKQHEEQIRRIYSGFLTEEELVALMNGGDIWVGPVEWIERYENMMKYFAEKIKQNEKETIPKKKSTKKNKVVELPPEN